MTKQVIWTAPALQQLEDIQDYVAETNPLAAFELAERVRMLVSEQLPDHP